MTSTPDFRVVVADDEPAARRGVCQLLRGFPEFQVVAECRNGAEVLSVLDAARPHVVFLDVQMPGVDGFEVVRRRSPERMPLIVFLTAYEEFAVDAFAVDAVDYLVKPVSAARFAASIGRIRRQLRGGGSAATEPTISVPTARGTLVLRADEIEWIEAEGNYVRLWTGERGHLLRASLGDLADRFGTHGFMRAHRRALVRLGAVKELIDDESGATFARLSSGARVDISRRRRAAFRRALARSGP